MYTDTTALLPNYDGLLWMAFALGIFCGVAIMVLHELFRSQREIEKIAKPLRIALATTFLGMSEDAAECDGFTYNQVAAIKEYGPLIGVTLTETTDRYGDPLYTITPKLLDKLTEMEQ